MVWYSAVLYGWWPYNYKLGSESLRVMVSTFMNATPSA